MDMRSCFVSLNLRKNRVEAKCPVAKQCGGCQIQEMDYQEQLQFKQKKVIGNLEQDRRICAGSIRKDHAAGVWDGRAVSLPE